MADDAPPTEKATVDSGGETLMAVGFALDSGGNRFETLELLGSGGIGQVYRARDLRLDRIVALKRLISKSPDAGARLMREAQHQARVDHPYVCKVYGFGEIDGHPYLALQFCEAGSLAEHYRELGRSERIRLLQRVALAVDAAHQIGLIHRDLKPSNILLEHEPTGGVIPLVADFGLARAVDALATRTGLAVGTPAYMSPEQAEGRRDVDHRTDIFSLGVTLYELVCDRRPFSKESANVLLDIVGSDPVPPRAIDRSISRDLEAIILRCLEKQPARRYPSARALADDLDRYLRGEPVVARPHTALYVARRWAWRRRGYVALALAAAVGIVGAAVVAVRARMHAAEGSRVAQRLGRELERIETGLRVAYLLPEHDVDVDRRRLASDLDAVRALVDGASAEASASGRVVLARALLLLDDPVAARRELERAGATSMEANVTLGETLLALYRREAVELDSLAGESRRVRAEELRTTYLAPAAAALAHGDPQTSPLVAAQLAVAEGRADAALSASREALARDPWQFEAHVLAGSVLRDRALERVFVSCDEARQLIDEATREFRAAREIARSLPAAHAGECSVALLVVHLAICGGADAEAAVGGAVTACERAHKVDPRRDGPLRDLATAEQVASDVILAMGKDPTAMVMRLVEVTARARAAHPAALWPLSAEGSAFAALADFELYGGKDPRDRIDRSLAAWQELNRRRPTATSQLAMAEVYESRGNYLAKIGEDPLPAYEAGITAATRATELAPASHMPFGALGGLCADRGNYVLERGEDPSAWFARARKAYERAIELRPGEPAAHHGIGSVARGQGVYIAGNGGDPTESYQASVAAYRKSIELDPRHFIPPYSLAEVLRYLAAYRIANGGESASLIGEARGLLHDLRKRKPANLPDVEEEEAALELAAARAVGPGEVAARVAAARSRLRALPVTPRRMALRAIAVAYDARAGARRDAEEVRILRAWARSASGPEARIVGAAIDLAEGHDARAALEENAHLSVFLRDEIRPLLD